MDYREREEERIRLKRAITEWNASRLDLFEITEPDEYLEFFGVMRFFFQEDNDKVSTKCVRVSSTASTSDVINILIEKFHPDMRMLTIPEYTLYEIHANGEERKVEVNERPLYVQLNWTTDLREGRFLLKKTSDRTALGFFETDHSGNQNFKRKLSKREKKEQKKKEKQAKLKAKEEGTSGEKLYQDLSKSRFTRTISNPDVVMRRRRQQKLDQMKKFQNRPDSGGTLKIYAHSVFPEVPYKTLLVSVEETSEEIISESLEKFGKEKANPADYCLVKVVVPPGEDPNEYSKKGGWGKEAIMDDDESPLSAVMRWPESRGELIFELKKKPDDYQPRKRRQQQGKKDPRSPNGQPGWYNDPSKVPQDRLPYFLELNNDGTDIIDYKPKRHRLQVNVTEVGSEREVSNNGQYLQLFSPGILPRHCVVANMEGVVTVTPTSPEAETYVNNQRIYETTMLQHGLVVRFGRHHTFRFCDPQEEDPDYRDSASKRNRENLETTFDSNGRIESSVSQDVLPAKLEFRESNEDQFLSAVVSEVDGLHVHFRLAPAYTMYLASRFRLSKMYRPEMGPTERAQRLTAFLNKISDLVDRTAQQDSFQTAGPLAFWLANASEILHFIQHDQDLGGISQDAQEILQDCVKDTFMNLARSMTQELKPALMAFFDPTTEADIEKEDDNVSLDSWQSGFSQRWLNPPGTGHSRGKPTLSDVCHIFLSAMTLLRRCRVNAALTIQIFSQLFHFINAFIFNKFVNPQNAQNCTRAWASRIFRRLSRLSTWAEKQGLEIAADTHLAQINQTFTLMLAPKKSKDDVMAASAQCFKLNSRQIGQILQNCQPDKNDRPIPRAWIDKAVNQAAATNDFGPAHSLPLEEELELRLAFVIPEDGYSCDGIKGIPNGFQEFLDPLARAGMVRLTPQPIASGVWTVHMYGQRAKTIDASPTTKEPPEPKPSQDEPLETFTMTLNKSGARGMGLSIIAAKGVGQERVGVYVKQVVPGGAAEKDGRLVAGDQLLEVDKNVLVGITQEMAAEFLMNTGQVVFLKVAKKGAIKHGLAELLVQTEMPQVNKIAERERSERPKSESMERPVPAPRNLPRAGMPGHTGLQNTDKARSSPNLAEDPRSVMPPDNRDHYSTMPRERTSSTSDMKPAQRYKGVKVMPSIPISQRSKSTSNLDPSMEDDRQMPHPQQSKSISNLQGPPGNRQGPPGNYHSPNYGDPYRQDQRPPPQRHEWSDGSDRGSIGQGRDAPDLESFEREPYQRRVPRPSDSYGPGPKQRGPPNQRGSPMDQRGSPMDQRGPPPDRRGPPPDHRGLPPDHRGPPPDHRGPPADHRGPPPDNRGPPSDYRGPPPDHRGPPPDHRGPPPDHRGPPPDHRGPPPDHRGPPPDHRGPPPDHRGPPLDHRGPPPDHRGLPPGQRGPDSRGMPPDQRGPDPRGMPLDQRGNPYDSRGPPPNRYYDQPPRSQPQPQPQPQQLRDHPPMYSPQDPQTQQRYPGPPQGSPYGPQSHQGSPYGAPPGQRPPIQSYDEPGIQATQQQFAYESAPPQQQLPPAPQESFHDEQDDLPPPPTELPPPPPKDARGYPEEFPPPPAQHDPRTGSLPRRSEAMAQYSQWHEQEKARLQKEHESRVREKQMQEEQMAQPQVDRPQYASLPRQSRITKPSGESAHPSLQRQNSVPKAVPGPKAPERTPASHELVGPRNGQQQPPRQSFEAPQRSMPQDNRYSAPDGRANQLQIPTNRQPPMETNIDDAAAPTSPSPWHRDLVDKKEQLEEERLKRMRELEMAELLEQPYLSPQQQDRLRKLRMEHEFQRRLEESQMYGDDDDEDDNEVRPAAAVKILRNMQEEEEAKRIREQNEKEYQRQLAMQQQRQDMAMRERQEERLQRLQNELASERARQQEEDQFPPPPPPSSQQQQQPWNGHPNNYNRPMDNDMALRHQEEEMQRRHEQQRLDYMRREAEIEQERRRLEEQLSLRGPQQYPPTSANNVVHTRVNAGYVPAPEKTYITDPPMPVEQAPIDRGVRRPTEQPPPPPVSQAPQQQANKSNSLPRPKPEIKPKPKPPPVAPKKNALNNRNNNARSATLPQGYKPPTSQYSNNYANSYPTPNSHPQNSYKPSTPASQNATTNSTMYGTPENSQNLNTYSTGDGNTPGVIGSQEVYRDPRDRILATKQQDEPISPQQLLSFKDKMKKFSGVTPEQKKRTSKWEREFLAQNPELAE